MALTGPSAFYTSFKGDILESLHERWLEDTPCLYDIVCFIQDELIAFLVERYPRGFPEAEDGSGAIEIIYDTTQEFRKIFDEA